MISFKTDYSYFMLHFLVDLKTAINSIKVRFNYHSQYCVSRILYRLITEFVDLWCSLNFIVLVASVGIRWLAEETRQYPTAPNNSR